MVHKCGPQEHQAIIAAFKKALLAE